MFFGLHDVSVNTENTLSPDTEMNLLLLTFKFRNNHISFFVGNSFTWTLLTLILFKENIVWLHEVMVT